MLGGSARATANRSKLNTKLGGLRVADVMDAEPVSIPAATTVEQALDEYFLRYRWPWFPVVDAGQRFLGLLNRGTADAVPEISRTSQTVSEIIDPGRVDGSDRQLRRADSKRCSRTSSCAGSAASPRSTPTDGSTGRDHPGAGRSGAARRDSLTSRRRTAPSSRSALARHHWQMASITNISEVGQVDAEAKPISASMNVSARADVAADRTGRAGSARSRSARAGRPGSRRSPSSSTPERARSRRSCRRARGPRSG